MPELPEVETTRRGIAPHVAGAVVAEVIIRRWDLRWPITPTIGQMEGRRIISLRRRSKYLLFGIESGSSLLVHLGMSGSLRLVAPGEPWKTHDHVGITMSGGLQLRFHDPRRFGVIFFLETGDPLTHPLLASLGPEPLEEEFSPAWLKKKCASRKSAIKLAIMDAKVVVGVGNIYASEALFRAGIRPLTPACKLSGPKLAKLVTSIREVLSDSIAAGGTTLRDFLKSDGEPGYFRQKLFVYERKGEPCLVCGTPISHQVMGQRSTYWCAKCQP